jgi:hypothetical protein
MPRGHKGQVLVALIAETAEAHLLGVTPRPSDDRDTTNDDIVRALLN